MNENPFVLIDRSGPETHSLSVSEYQTLVLSETETLRTYAAQKADKIRRDIYGDSIYIRGLIEVSNVCRNDCYYCGIRASNRACDGYLLTDDQDPVLLLQRATPWGSAPLSCRAARGDCRWRASAPLSR